MCTLQYYWYNCLVYMKTTKIFSFTYSLKGFDARVWKGGFLFSCMN